jgi:single-strand DNA-binding protein
MASLNSVHLIGNLTRDPEVRYTPKGTAVADIGIAVNRKYKGDNGEKREEVTFIDVTLWGQTAEYAGEYGQKGRSVFVDGRIQMESWDDKQSGQKRSKLKVVADSFQLLSGKEKSEGQQPSAPSRPPAKPQPPRDPDLDPDAEGDPF